MANVFTAIAPTLFSAARVVPRELAGVLASVSRDFNDMGVAKGDSVKISVAPALATASVTPSQTFTEGSSRTAAASTLTLNQFKEVSWHMTAEQERSLQNSQTARDMLQQTIEQGFRALINEMEAYVWGVARKAASRASGAGGTTPFASDISAAPLVRKILQDNGAPDGDRSLVIDSAAGVKLRSLGNLVQYLQAGDTDALRRGLIGEISGMMVRESAQIVPVTKGGGTLYTSNGTGLPVGTTSIPLITGSGDVLAGDCVTFAGDSNVYIVKTGIAAPGTIEIQEPGLKVAIAASAVAMTIGDSFTANLAMHRSAVVLVARPAIQPEGAIAEQMVLADPLTRMSALLLRVPGNAQSSWYLRTVYDAFAPNPYAIAILRG